MRERDVWGYLHDCGHVFDHVLEAFALLGKAREVNIFDSIDTSRGVRAGLNVGGRHFKNLNYTRLKAMLETNLAMFRVKERLDYV